MNMIICLTLASTNQCISKEHASVTVQYSLIINSDLPWGHQMSGWRKGSSGCGNGHGQTGSGLSLHRPPSQNTSGTLRSRSGGVVDSAAPITGTQTVGNGWYRWGGSAVILYPNVQWWSSIIAVQGVLHWRSRTFIAMHIVHQLIIQELATSTFSMLFNAPAA